MRASCDVRRRFLRGYAALVRRQRDLRTRGDVRRLEVSPGVRPTIDPVDRFLHGLTLQNQLVHR